MKRSQWQRTRNEESLRLEVQCHCGREIVYVPRARLLDGGSCGRANCVYGCEMVELEEDA